MKTAYFDCSMGISGDMTVAALVDAGADWERIQASLASLGLPGVRVEIGETMRCGFRALKFNVHHPEQHAHRHLADIHHLLDQSQTLTTRQRALATGIFEHVARAEAKVHGSTMDQVHFHEVGAIDSICDIVATAVAFDSLGIEQVVCSSVPTGFGQVLIDHGVCSVPTPGTAELLRGVPLADVPVEAELTTPTGAAIVQSLVDRFERLPSMQIDQIGYGAGTKDFPHRANVLRVFVGHQQPAPDQDEIVLLETNLDDVSPEVLGYTQSKLFENGALDVYATPILMKKNRPATLLAVICPPAEADRLEEIVFAETGTLGIRRQRLLRSRRHRESCDVTTPFGTIAGKLAWRGGGTKVFTPEFDSCARAAAEAGVPLREVYRAAHSAHALAAESTTGSSASAEVHSSDHSHDHSHGDAGHSHDHHHGHRHDHDHHH